MGTKMAGSGVKTGKCHKCDKRFPVKDMADDEPFGLLCIPCEDNLYGHWMDVGEEYPLTEH